MCAETVTTPHRLFAEKIEYPKKNLLGVVTRTAPPTEAKIKREDKNEI